MGRSKVRKIKPKKKVPPKLETYFNCPFCSCKKSIYIKFNRSAGFAKLKCMKCDVNYVQEITSLDESIDVYSEWVDKCLDLNQKKNIDNDEMMMEREVDFSNYDEQQMIENNLENNSS